MSLPDSLPLWGVLLLALGFTFTNGFHDAANAIATSVSTRALTPRIALAMAAAMNLLGAFLGVEVARTIGSAIVSAPSGATGLTLCAGALIGAIAWNLLTWWKGLPSSSTHALVGGLGGAALAAGAEVKWTGVVDRVLIPMLVSPAVGLVGGFLVMTLVLWVFRRRHPDPVNRGFRYAQTLSAAAMAFGHGMQDAGKAAGVVALAMTAAGVTRSPAHVPLWVLAVSAVVLSLGTYVGGWRIIRTLGHRIIPLDPPAGFAAESTAAAVLYAATAFQAPISTTHAITSAIMGAGAARRVRAVRWALGREILLAWVLTFPAAGAVGAAAYAVLRLLT